MGDEHDDDEGTEHDDDDDGEKGKPKGKGKPAGDNDELVDAVAARVLELLGESDGGGADGGDGGDGGDGKAGGGAPRSAADLERATEQAVRKAMGELRREEAQEGRLRKLERTVQEKVKEAAPAQYRRLTKIMWGPGDRR